MHAALARLRLRPAFAEAASLLRTALPSVRAVHFRLGDRPGLALACARPRRLSLAQNASAPAELSVGGSEAERWGWDDCPLATTEEAFAAWSATGPVYVATNRPRDPRAASLRARTGARLWEDLVDHAPPSL